MESGSLLWKSVLNLGSINLLLLVIILPLLNYFISNAIYAKSYRNNIVQHVNNVFKLTALSIVFHKVIPNINIHYFVRKTIHREDYLIKERRFLYESRSLPKDYSFEGCRVNTQHIVMCRAFREKSVLFKNLPPNHTELYDEDIKNKVDVNIKWVLASPVWKDNMSELPDGVIVIYSPEMIAGDNENDKITDLEQIGIELSKTLSNIIFGSMGS